MATYKTGILSPFSGQIAEVVGSSWRTLNVMKKIPTRSKKAAVQSQIDQRTKFAVMSRFMGGVGDLISVGYHTQKGVLTPKNVALRYHLANAITGVYPNFIVDFPKVVLSKGNLERGMAGDLVTPGNGEVQVNWEMSNIGEEDLPLRKTDVCYIAFYDVEESQFILMKAGPTRDKLTANVRIPSAFVGHTLHGWLFFRSADGKSVSRSEYLKSIVMQ